MNAYLNTFAAASALLLAALPASAATLSVNPVSSSVTLGSSVSVALEISGLGDLAAPSLGTFDLNLDFNPAILSYNGVTFGDPVLGDQLDLFGLGSLTDVTPGAGSVRFFELSFDPATDLDSLQTGSFTLLTLTFDTIAVGNSSLNLAINALGDANGDPLAYDTNNGELTVMGSTNGSVPEPAILSLFAIGLLGMGYLRRG